MYLRSLLNIIIIRRRRTRTRTRTRRKEDEEEEEEEEETCMLIDAAMSGDRSVIKKEAEV